MIKELSLKQFKQYLLPRPKECHKGNFGKVLVIGGNLGYAGAVRLAGEAALRVGAGMVNIATRPEHATTLTITCPELMCLGVMNDSSINALLDRATFIIVGPGLGQDDWALWLLKRVLDCHEKPRLFDADALNLLAQSNQFLRDKNCIYTPHPGEAARLLKINTSELQNDRITSIKKLHELLYGCVVLKGAGTLILSDSGEMSCCNLGNPGMASGGMGDVLSGVIGGLAAQHIPLTEAAKLGVLVHAMAGDLAAKQGERGLLASDVMPFLRRLINL